MSAIQSPATEGVAKAAAIISRHSAASFQNPDLSITIPPGKPRSLLRPARVRQSFVNLWTERSLGSRSAPLSKRRPAPRLDHAQDHTGGSSQISSQAEDK